MEKPPEQRVHVLEVVGNAITGGMESYVRALVRRLPADRFTVSVLAPFESAFTRDLRAAGANVYLAPLGEPLSDQLHWDAVLIASTLVRSSRIDVIHAHLTNAHVLSATVGRLTGTPVLATLHGRIPALADVKAHRLAASHLSVVCRYTYLRAIALGASGAHLHVVPNGVDTDRFRPGEDGAPFRASIGVAPDAPLVGFVGRMSYEKGPEVFVRVAALVHASRPDVRFVMVGDGPLRAGIEASAKRAGLGDALHFTGHVDDPRPAYAAMDVAASTSHSEGLPFAVLEAMACGVPVVGTLVGGVPEVVEHDVSGLLAADDDHNEIARHVLALVASSERRVAMGHAARDRMVELFSLERSAEATGDLLARLAKTEGGTAVAPIHAVTDRRRPR